MIALLILLASTVTPAASGCAPVAGERILGADLARVLPVFSAIPADLALGYTPQPGLHRLISSDQLARLAREHGIPEQVWTPVCFLYPLSPLADADLVQAMRTALGDDRLKITVEDVIPRAAPAGKVIFTAAALQPPRPGESSSQWHGFVQYSLSRRYPITVRVRVVASATRVVATAPLTVGQPILPESVRLDTVEGFPSTLAQARKLEDVAGKLPRRTLPAGAVIYLSELTSPLDIAKGERVQVEVRNGGARLMLDAQAQAPGRAGDTIPVKNLQSGRSFPARIAGKGKVVVTLKGNLP